MPAIVRRRALSTLKNFSPNCPIRRDRHHRIGAEETNKHNELSALLPPACDPARTGWQIGVNHFFLDTDGTFGIVRRA